MINKNKIIMLACTLVSATLAPMFAANNPQNNNTNTCTMATIQRHIEELTAVNNAMQLLQTGCTKAIEKANGEQEYFENFLAHTERRKHTIVCQFKTAEEVGFYKLYMALRRRNSHKTLMCACRLHFMNENDFQFINDHTSNASSTISACAQDVLFLVKVGRLIKSINTACKECRTAYNECAQKVNQLSDCTLQNNTAENMTEVTASIHQAILDSINMIIATYEPEKNETIFSSKEDAQRALLPSSLSLESYYITYPDEVKFYCYNLKNHTTIISNALEYVQQLKTILEQQLTEENNQLKELISKSKESNSKKTGLAQITKTLATIPLQQTKSKIKKHAHQPSEEQNKTVFIPMESLKGELPYTDMAHRVALWFNDPQQALIEEKYDLKKYTKWIKTIHRFSRTVDIFIQHLAQKAPWGNNGKNISYYIPGSIIYQKKEYTGYFTFGITHNSPKKPGRIYHRCFMQCVPEEMQELTAARIKQFQRDAETNTKSAKKEKVMPEWRAQANDTITDRQTYIEIYDSENDITIRLLKPFLTTNDNCKDCCTA